MRRVKTSPVLEVKTTRDVIAIMDGTSTAYVKLPEGFRLHFIRIYQTFAARFGLFEGISGERYLVNAKDSDALVGCNLKL